MSWIPSIDTLLGGGLRKGQLTEITGQSSSGKTQVKTRLIFLFSTSRWLICLAVNIVPSEDCRATHTYAHQLQVCLYSAAHVAARHMGVVLYLDTSNSFSPSRIAHILDELPISLIKEVSNKPVIHVPALLLPIVFTLLGVIISFSILVV